MLSTALTAQLYPNEPRRRRIDKSPRASSENERPESWESIILPPVTAAKRVVLVRHGQSTWNAEGRIQGSSDFSVLTHRGESQAETTRRMLLEDSFDVCFASPLARSKRTAEIIWGRREAEIVEDSNLREIDLYSFQGLLKNEGKAKHGEAYRRWQKDASNFSIDGHYPVRELWSRARRCWTRILTHESSSILVVAHNAVNQALVATTIGLGTEYFRVLLQSNCGVSVLDFAPNPEGGSPEVCLNRLNQTPSSPLDDSNCARIILVAHGFPQKTAELLLDVKVRSIVGSRALASIETAELFSYNVEKKYLPELDVENILGSTMSRPLRYEEEVKTAIWDQSGVAWRRLLDELSLASEGVESNVVVVGHPALHVAMVGHCLGLNKECLGSFHLDPGSISVVEFPDGPAGRGVIRCINYTAHLGKWSTPITRSIGHSP